MIKAAGISQRIKRRITFIAFNAIFDSKDKRHLRIRNHSYPATYDHVLPHSRGGTSELSNTLIVCQPCNCARMQYSLEEVDLLDPRLREPSRAIWDGLERFS